MDTTRFILSPDIRAIPFGHDIFPSATLFMAHIMRHSDIQVIKREHIGRINLGHLKS